MDKVPLIRFDESLHLFLKGISLYSTWSKRIEWWDWWSFKWDMIQPGLSRMVQMCQTSCYSFCMWCISCFERILSLPRSMLCDSEPTGWPPAQIKERSGTFHWVMFHGIRQLMNAGLPVKPVRWHLLTSFPSTMPLSCPRRAGRRKEPSSTKRGFWFQ